ncbi:hypothetical protein SAMN04488020_10739 [Palleronia marisminoris]|uniref:DUF5671 domain-containing protein n=1 Tax=Palleronia marisminoris TaxID=315423 RepID=A0A1Y5T1Q4_9RHOB|nr:DUF5671 domain-containing protein [Palleronia marisminoris]SFH13398.1 hypothetical protein SAMN04488020_10739 [Palleronia marisminoris]SLN53448.1 hypothetical protein PAM7066_02511 [Palleronia marisminoris]
MRARSDLVRFVRDALAAGRGRDEIHRAILGAGWREKDADRALAAFHAGDFVPPVPRPQAFVSARDAVIYGLGFFALGVVVVCFVSLLFDAVEALTDPMWRGGLEQQAWRVAAIVVFAPLFAATDWRADRESPVRKICAYAALFFSALVILFTLVSVIALGLSGGLTLALGAKALVVAGTAGGIMAYYRGDFRADREG